MDDFKDLVWSQVKALRPSFVAKKPHFNFITAHYLWIVSLVITGSVVIFGTGRGNLAYIDALFFASSASTQAGLNTVNVNLLNTFQQVTIYLIIMMANPITIHSFVVFLRLYWFEKRFQNVVREARQRRGTISKAKSRSKPNHDPDEMERGVNGRNITVMHNDPTSRITNDGILLEPTEEKPDDDDDDDDETPEQHQNGVSPKTPNGEPHENRRPEIKFADTVKRSDGLGDDMTKLPPTRPDEDHIAILERQRKGDDEVLRIPGPRDVELGMLPKRVEQGDEEDNDLATRATRDSRAPGENDGPARPPTAATEGRTQAITIEEPERPKRHLSPDELADDARAAVKTLSVLRFRKPRILNRHKNKKPQPQPGGSNLHLTPSKRRQTFENIRTAFTRDADEGTPYLSWEPTLGRNSQFPDLTEEQRDELGGIEYRSLKTLALVLIGYFWGFSTFAVICLVPWILHTSPYGEVVDSAGQSRTWWGFFTANSAFMDVGLTLTPDSMLSFNTAVFPLILMSFLIVIGNTGFPVMLRFIIWVMSFIVPRGTGIYEEVKFLLDHPRRCFTLLFPSAATWWLFWLLVILNGLDLILFIILDLGSDAVSDLPVGIRILDGLFQATATRTAGFSCISLSLLHPAVQTSYLIMMYISVFPVAISVRRTNVYEENSLGIYGGNDADDQNNASELSYVGAHLRRQLSFDLWFIFLGFFILNITEGSRLMSGDMSMFAILFEIVSAYGTVGLSLGYDGVDAALSSQFSVVGKLVIIAMQIRGRHRGLPYGLDRAILLPSESLRAKEAVDADARLSRRPSQASVLTGRQGTSLRRVRSRSMDRVNSNIITQFLHPGPPPNKATAFSPMRRVMTGPGPEDDGSSISRLAQPRRAETTSLAGCSTNENAA